MHINSMMGVFDLKFGRLYQWRLFISRSDDKACTEARKTMVYADYSQGRLISTRAQDVSIRSIELQDCASQHWKGNY